jgi:parallel beta-helix repeat protein
MKNSELHDCGVEINGYDDSGPSFWNGSNVILDSCIISGCGVGIYFENSTSTSIKNCTITDCYAGMLPYWTRLEGKIENNIAQNCVDSYK